MLPLSEKTCFILLPGFAPDNYPVLELKDKLNKLGYTAVASNFWGVELVSDFSKLTSEQCKKGIADIITKLSKKYEIIIGIGISLGGALLMEHAKSFTNLDCVVSIGTPFKLKNKRLMSLGFALYPLAYIYWNILRALRLRPTPIPAARAMVDYMTVDFVKDLDKIKTPLLLIHSKHDLVTDVSVIPFFMKKISSQHKKIIYLDNISHAIGYNNDIIIQEINAFLNYEKKFQ